MARSHGWERRLADAIRDLEREPFQWGERDCAMTACRLVEAVLSRSIAPVRAYDSALAAARLAGPSGLEAAAADRAASLGFEEIAPLRAGRGDVVLFDTDSGPALGVVALDGRNIVVQGSEGLVRRPMREARRAWRVA